MNCCLCLIVSSYRCCSTVIDCCINLIWICNDRCSIFCLNLYFVLIDRKSYLARNVYSLFFYFYCCCTIIFWSYYYIFSIFICFYLYCSLIYLNFIVCSFDCCESSFNYCYYWTILKCSFWRSIGNHYIDVFIIV